LLPCNYLPAISAYFKDRALYAFWKTSPISYFPLLTVDTKHLFVVSYQFFVNNSFHYSMKYECPQEEEKMVE
jgi:hypothetical protein